MRGARSKGPRALWQLPQLLPLPRLRLRRLGAGPLAGGQLRLILRQCARLAISKLSFKRRCASGASDDPRAMPTL